MTAANYPACEDRVLAHEGSKYTDGIHPYDPGGPTRWGITLTDARLHWKPNATASDVATMPREIACNIYRSKYWATLNADNLASGVDDAVFDYGVNSGVGRAGKVLRRVLGLPDKDWHVTSDVLAALGRCDSKAVIHAICQERLRFLAGLSIWPIYGRGWTRRVQEVEAYSIALADKVGAKPPLPASDLNMAAGIISPPTSVKAAVKSGGAGGAVVVGAGWWEWFAAHPYAIGFSIVAALVVIGGVIYLINETHRARQEAPTPGIIPVPEK